MLDLLEDKIQNQKALDDYFLALGKVVSNLQSLELIIRLFLHNADPRRYGASPPEAGPSGTGLQSLVVGGVVPENYITNYDSLGDLVTRYNNMLQF